MHGLIYHSAIVILIDHKKKTINRKLSDYPGLTGGW